jgi:hypothetical protein
MMNKIDATLCVSLAILLSLYSAVAVAQDLTEGRGGDPGGDELIFVPPEGWVVIGQTSTDELYEVTFVPSDQSATEWSAAIRGQIFFNLTTNVPNMSAPDFTENLTRYYESVCHGAKASPVSAWDDHGFPAAIRLISCARQRGTELGSVSMIKVMRGRTSMFVLDRSWRGSAYESGTMPVSQETRDEWAEFLARSFLCNRGDPNTPCPVSR